LVVEVVDERCETMENGALPWAPPPRVEPVVAEAPIKVRCAPAQAGDR